MWWWWWWCASAKIVLSFPLSLSLSLSFCLSSSPHIKQMKKWRRNEWMKLKCVCRRSLPHTSQLRMEERIFFFYVCGETEDNEHHCLDSMKWWCMKIVLIRPLCERIWCVCVPRGFSINISWWYLLRICKIFGQKIPEAIVEFARFYECIRRISFQRPRSMNFIEALDDIWYTNMIHVNPWQKIK